VIAVAATTANGCQAKYSNAGPQVDVAAPGGGPDAVPADDDGLVELVVAVGQVVRQRCTQGRRITGVGSSDWHAAPNPLDVANARVYAASLTENAILSGIRAGHVIVMNGAHHPTPAVAVRSGDQSVSVGGSLTITPTTPIQIDIRAESLANGKLVVVSNGQRDAPVPLDAQGEAHIQKRPEPGYVRFELSAADGTLVALTNPVYLKRQ
jgi:hypothetical protein